MGDIHGLLHRDSSHLQERQHINEGEWADLDGFSTLHTHVRLSKNDNPLEIVWDMFEAPFLLVIVGIMSALVSCACNTMIDYGNSIRFSLISTSTDYVAWSLYAAWCVGFSLLACFVTSTTCQEAAGSGLPEMKTILSGVIKPVLLSVRLIIAKTFGLTFSIIGGLSVGKEGPFVQISGAIADQLMKLPMFKHIRTQDSKRLEIIACACASGVGATFGTAFGGVFFSIELTSSAYLVRTVPKAFLSSVCAMLTIYYLNISDQLALFNDESVADNRNATWPEMTAFLCVGLFTGILGVLFVTIVEQISKFRNKFLDISKHSYSTVAFRRYLMVGLVSMLVAIPLYYELVTVPNALNGSKTLLDHLFQADDMRNIVWKLVPYFFYKFIATALSVTLPLPVGLFTPAFLAGGVLGRIVGEVLCVFAPFKNFVPSDYAILGAAGFATGITRAISTAIIVYELSGQPRLRLPLAVVVLAAYFIGNRFSKNVYEALIDTNGTPYMQEIPKHLYNIPVSTVMIELSHHHVLALDSTYQDAHNLLQLIKQSNVQLKAVQQNIDKTVPDIEYYQQPTNSSGVSPQNSNNLHHLKHYSPSVIPIVKTKKSMVIVGAVGREDLARSVRHLEDILAVARRRPIVLGLSDKENDVELADYPSSGNAVVHLDSSFQSKVDNICSDPMMKEKIQYVMLADGGKTVVPVASKATSVLEESTVSWKSFPLAVILDPSPYQIVDTMQLSKVDLLFRMLSLSQAYVTNSGKLVGFVTRSALREFLGKHHRRPLDKCKQLNHAIWHTLCGGTKHEYDAIPENETFS